MQNLDRGIDLVRAPQASAESQHEGLRELVQSLMSFLELLVRDAMRFTRLMDAGGCLSEDVTKIL